MVYHIAPPPELMFALSPSLIVVACVALFAIIIIIHGVGTLK